MHEDAKLTEAGKKCGKHWVVQLLLVPGRTFFPVSLPMAV
jgi:hypothetical protein